MSNLITQFARQKYVKRWNGRKTLSEFNRLEHTARVAFISRELMRIASDRGCWVECHHVRCNGICSIARCE